MPSEQFGRPILFLNTSKYLLCTFQMKESEVLNESSKYQRYSSTIIRMPSKIFRGRWIRVAFFKAIGDGNNQLEGKCGVTRKRVG